MPVAWLPLALSAAYHLPGGSYVAIATPMRNDGAVDYCALRALNRWHVEEKTDGVVVLGTTGEASTLTRRERHDVVSLAASELRGTRPLLVGTGGIDTAVVVEETRNAARLGADAALVVTPYYVKPTQRGLVQHFTEIADSGELPLVLYNVPGRTGVDLDTDTVVQLSAHPNVVGLKDATGDNARVERMRRECDPTFRLFSGEDAHACDYVLRGGDGVISVTANVAPRAVARVMASAAAGDADAARAADRLLRPVHDALFCESNPIPVKYALHALGRTPEYGVRLPLTRIADAAKATVDRALEGLHVSRPDPSFGGTPGSTRV